VSGASSGIGEAIAVRLAQAGFDVFAGVRKERDAARVLAIAQLSREAERRPDKRPQLSDLRDSGALEQDANTVLLLYRADR
jgi:NAD(P)-dependent dehydrogenase (short-subunit alcohol dehydrogenase family)